MGGRGKGAKLTWPACADCGDPDGRLGTRDKSPIRYNGRPFGIEGQLCSSCYSQHHHALGRASKAVPCSRCGQLTSKPPFCQPCGSRNYDLVRKSNMFGKIMKYDDTLITHEEVKDEWKHLESWCLGDIDQQLRTWGAFSGEMLTSLSDHGPLWSRDTGRTA